MPGNFYKKLLLKKKDEEDGTENISDQIRIAPTPLPKKQFLVLSCILISESISITMLFPFVGFMVEDFGIATSKREIGYYAGLIASSFNVAQFISSFWWGTLSDRYGRRPILLAGLLGNTLSIILFGYSTTLVLSILFRSLNGLLNGNTGVAKTYIREITDSTNEAQGFSIVSLVWGLGSIIGPTIGGILAKPAESFAILKGTHFEDFPYALPCMVSATFSIIGFLTGFSFLPETLVKGAKDNEILLETINTDEVENAPETPLEDDTEESVPAPKKEKVLLSLLKDNNVKIAVLLYGTVCFTWIIFDEVFAFWLMLSPQEGGLGFTSTNIGVQLGITGFFLIIFQSFVYRRLNAFFGVVPLFRLCMIGAALTFSVIPFFHEFASTDTSHINYKLWALLIPAGLFKTSFGGAVFSATMIMVGNSTTKDKTGAVNGLGQSVGALTRAIGPALGGSMFSWSNTNGIGFPLDYHFTFLLLGVICLTTAVVSLKVPNNIASRK